ncbi:hypothetical protein BGP_0458 [Beggiatoa sp. PS]|nr:hypothetical protein BGP_0458 [Beggiatoa sp. PS]
MGFLIQAGAYCGLKTDRTGMCHSGNLTSSAFPVSGVFTYMAGSYYHGCGLRNNGAVGCWGSDYYGQTTPPTGVTFKQPSPTLTPPQPIELINLSTRATIQKGAGNVIAGFIIRGNGAKRILIRAWGRGLGFATGLDAYLTLTTINGNVIDENDNWQNHRNASSIPDHYRLPDPTDAALLLYLPAGAYTAIMSSRGTTGIGLIGVNAID